MTIKKILKKIEVKYRRKQKINIIEDRRGQIECNIAYASIVEQQNIKIFESVSNIVIEMKVSMNNQYETYTLFINELKSFIKLIQSISGISITKHVIFNETGTIIWYGISANPIGLYYITNYASKLFPEYNIFNSFIKIFIDELNKIPILNKYLELEEIDAYNIDNVNLLENDIIQYIDTYDKFDTFLLDEELKNDIDTKIKCLLPLCKVYCNNIIWQLDNLIYRLINCSDVSYLYKIKTYMLKNYSNFTINDHHIIKDYNYFIYTNNITEDKLEINNLYYKDIDEEID